jgi:hypothetical protein
MSCAKNRWKVELNSESNGKQLSRRQTEIEDVSYMACFVCPDLRAIPILTVGFGTRH